MTSSSDCNAGIAPSSAFSSAHRAQSAGRPIWQEFARYFAASLLALSIDFATLTVLVEWAHWHYLPAATAGFAIGTVVTFLISNAWVFRSHSYTHWSAGLAVFALIGVSGLLVNLMLMWAGTDLLALDYRAAKLGAAGGSFLFNFSARKLALFNRSVGSLA